VKTIATILLFFCMLIYVGGYYLFFAWHQANLKTEMKAYLKQHKSSKYGTVIQLKTNSGQINDTNFSWEDDGTEFRYHDLLYDVVTIDHQAGMVSICCLLDNSENQLEQQINDIHKTENKQTNKSGLSIKYFSNFCILKSSTIQFYPPENFLYNLFPQNKISNYSSKIICPPPQC